ncbi:hypothetical protein [Streptomyces griseus]|uniref:hypothetical protein n=1 Tax=Streptomyces griseus TaxID=1911 RepID=UPI0033FA4F29
MTDEMEYFAERESIERVMANPEATYRDKLVSLRDYVAHELESNRCKTCFNSQLRTGDTASLVLRLQKIIEEIAALPEPGGEVTRLELIRGSATSRTPEAAAPPPAAQRWEPGA